LLDSRLAEQKQNSSSLLSNYRNEKAYILFISSLKSKYTKIKYDGCLQKYLKFEGNRTLTSLDQVLKKDPKIIEGEIIEQLIEMKNKRMSFSTLSVHLAAMHSFFSINDISINIKKLSKFVGEQESKYEYRPYTHEEITKLLALCDERGKAIVMLLASTAMRIGAIPELRLKHLKRYDLADGSHVYRLIVYASSKKSKYITFCTPECAKVLDEYLEYRNRIIQNNVNRDPETKIWGPPDAYLITRQFDMNEVPTSSAIFKKPMTAQGLRTYIVNRLKKMNLRRSWKSPQYSNEYIASYKNELHPCHSFRIFAITQMQRARIDKTIREMLVGHKTGLDSVYYKASEEEILLEYSKSVELLSIDKEIKLKIRIKELEEKNNINENLIDRRLIKKDSEVEELKKQDKIKEEALLKLSDQVMMLMKELQQIKLNK
jgi:integrase